jgi:hypothetical protein
MSRKILGILIVIAGLLIMVGIVYFGFLGNFSFFGFLGDETETQISEPEEQEIETEVQESNQTVRDRVPEAVIRERPIVDEPEVQPVETIKRNDISQFNKTDLKRMAASFAERFGSYSSHSNFSNIVDLKVFMSSKMEKWADSYVFEQRKQGIDKSIYFGITTKSVAEEVKSFDDDMGIASVLVLTRRREYTGSMNNLSNTYDQNVLIEFVNERGAWKVNDAVWQ